MDRQQQQTRLISVVMPVHNALPHLDLAVNSILEQTYSNFEFVIFDDASTDGSSERLQHWAGRDPRIRLVRGERNLGPAASSNRVVGLAAADIIARMDADDVSLPERLERQVELLEERADVGLVGTMCKVIDSAGRDLRGPEYWRIARKSLIAPFPHGSIMFRRELFDAVGGYRDECEYWEDLDFVLRMSRRSKILVISSPLYLYRQSPTSTRAASDQDRVERAVDLRYRSIDRVRQKRGYDDLLRERSSVGDARIDPRVFISLGSLALWSNRRPKLVGRLLSRGRLGFDMPTFAALVWTIWASTSPGTLRGFMRLTSKARNARLGSWPSEGAAIEWGTSEALSEDSAAVGDSASPATG
jgi:glycosyltransferase involved in cell wall biosynthesis